MKTPQILFKQSRPIRWRPRQQWSRGVIPDALYPWLTDRGSLTDRLITASNGHFSVEVLDQGIGRPLAEEARKLNMKPRSRALIREVLLLGLGTPWVFARSIVPLSTMTGRCKALGNLSDRPLGAFLFADPHMERSPLEIACLTATGSGDYQCDFKGGRGDNLWGRRSLFFLDRKPLLVNEIFLSTFKPLQ